MRDRVDFLSKKVFPKKWGKWAQNGLPIGFFQFIENFNH